MTDMGTMLSDYEHLGYGADGERCMENTLEHLHMKPQERERVIVICDPSESQSDKWQSVLLIGMLNDIAGKSARGIVDFDTYADAGDTQKRASRIDGTRDASVPRTEKICLRLAKWKRWGGGTPPLCLPTQAPGDPRRRHEKRGGGTPFFMSRALSHCYTSSAHRLRPLFELQDVRSVRTNAAKPHLYAPFYLAFGRL